MDDALQSECNWDSHKLTKNIQTEGSLRISDGKKGPLTNF